MAAAMAELQRQAGDDPDELAISEASTSGRVAIEGTVDVQALVNAAVDAVLQDDGK